MGNQATISLLHIEDDDEYAQYFKSVFNPERFGSIRFRISRVTSLGEASKFLKMAKPSVVVLDLNLPDSDGLRTFTKLKPWLYHVPTIIISSSPDAALIQSLKASGVKEFLVKSMTSFEQITRSVKSCIDRYQLAAA